MEDDYNLEKWLVGGDYYLEYVLTTAALLHSLDGVLTRSAIARATGLNERLLGHYASGFRKPRPQQHERIINGIREIGSNLVSVV